MAQQREAAQPVQLVSVEGGKYMRVNREVVRRLLEENDGSGEIGVVVVVGRYRTGKSYLLNRVLLQQNHGFQVGPTVNACTKGLWVWPKLIKGDRHSRTTKILVMDTQGLGSLQQGQNSDMKVFLLAMLLSSYFIYNSVGNIDERAVQSLSLVVQLSDFLGNGDTGQTQRLIKSFPSFLWLVRDFALRLEDQTGKPLQPSQYLQNALRIQRKQSKANDKTNVRATLTKYFKQRDCFTLIQPTTDEDKLRRLATLKNEELRPEFLQRVQSLRRKIFANIRPKVINGNVCSLGILLQMCQYFCQAINNDSVPQIGNNWNTIRQAENRRRAAKYCKQFESTLNKYKKMQDFQLNINQYERQSQSRITQLLGHMGRHALGSSQEIIEQVAHNLRFQFEQVKQTLQVRIAKRNQQQLNVQLQHINKNLSKIKSLVEVIGVIDSWIQRSSLNGNRSTIATIYQKAYQGFKQIITNYYLHLSQSQHHKQNILTRKAAIYQKSCIQLQEQCSKTKINSQDKQQRLKGRIFVLEFKAKQANQQLQHAKQLLRNLQSQQLTQ